MPRIRGINITAMVREELGRNTPVSEIVRRARGMSPHPNVWTEYSVVLIARRMASSERQDTARRIEVTSRQRRVSNDNVRQVVEEVHSASNDLDQTKSFGVEIEFLRANGITTQVIANRITALGVSTRVEGYGHVTRSHWKIVSDSTVSTHCSTHVGCCEIVSPILKGDSGLDQINKVCQVLNDLDCRVNKSCGIHIHHNCRDLGGQKILKVATNVLVIYKKYQSKFNNMLPRSRHNAYYSRSIRPSQIRHLRGGASLQSSISSRYCVVNVHSFYRHGTLEFRQHGGSTSFKKIVMWIKITQKIMSRAREMVDSGVDIWNHSFRRFNSELDFSNDMNDFYQQRCSELQQINSLAA